ncbi:hypothetical protein VB264_16865 [Arcicella aquatica]|uniref:Uncharacterized protein n=1 Tax=Arcicella aquatica TaxID=217141 RepID=A0ABU5QS11_9BACT|nr:hypothetical protein [Arcicella aquatica]MEA5259474.1 hypothetical protein [Arcicella aquatica]
MNWLKLVWGFIGSGFAINYKMILQEVLVSIIVSVLVWAILKPFGIEQKENKELFSLATTTQRTLDSLRFQEILNSQQTIIDSLSNVIHTQHESDSLRANARLSKLEAARAINNYLQLRQHSGN